MASTQWMANATEFEKILVLELNLMSVPATLPASGSGSRVRIETPAVIINAAAMGTQRVHGPCLQAARENTSSMRRSPAMLKRSKRCVRAWGAKPRRIAASVPS